MVMSLELRSSDFKHRIFNNSHHCIGTGKKCELMGMLISPGGKFNFKNDSEKTPKRQEASVASG